MWPDLPEKGGSVFNFCLPSRREEEGLGQNPGIRLAADRSQTYVLTSTPGIMPAS